MLIQLLYGKPKSHHSHGHLEPEPNGTTAFTVCRNGEGLSSFVQAFGGGYLYPLVRAGKSD